MCGECFRGELGHLSGVRVVTSVVCTPVIIFTFGHPRTLIGAVRDLLLGDRTSGSSLFIFISNTESSGRNRFRGMRTIQRCIGAVGKFGSIRCAFSRAGGKLKGSIVTKIAGMMGRCKGMVMLRSSLILSRGFLSFVGRTLSFCGGGLEIFSVYK